MAATVVNSNINITGTLTSGTNANMNVTSIDVSDRTAIISLELDPSGSYATISSLMGHPEQAEGIVDYKIMEDLKELEPKRLAALILMLPAGNNIRELARRVLKEKTPGAKVD